MRRERMGRLLLEAGAVSEHHIQEALDIQRRTGARLGSILIEMGAITESVFVECLSRQLGIPRVALDEESEVTPDVLHLVPVDLAVKHTIMPVRKTGRRLALAMVDPSNMAVIDDLKFRTGLQISPLIAMESSIIEAIARWYAQDGATGSAHSAAPCRHKARADEASGLAKDSGQIPGSNAMGGGEVPATPLGNLQDFVGEMLSDLPAGEENETGHDLFEDHAPIVNLVNRLLREAGEQGASDVHIEPGEESVRVRFRLDGALRTAAQLPKSVRHAVLARIKIMAGLDIAERRLPQDGRMKLHLSPVQEIDVRVSLLPCLHGEKAVLRLLDQSRLKLDVNLLGFDEVERRAVLAALEQPHGLILVTGPTGSGKTTTLYSALQFLNRPDLNIVTVEDPVEYHLPGINQLQVKEDIGLTFSMGLRAFLRQDPDVIMVGEVRDRETARIAVQAALTGHRVLSTLHTNDAPRAVTRLLDMGIEPFLVSSSVSLVIAQRLARRICGGCKDEDPRSRERLVNLGLAPERADCVIPRKGRGCTACHGTGFHGRIGLFEVLSLSEAFHDKILKRAPAHELKAAAVQAGLRTLRQSGLRAIQAGLTTVDEVASVTPSDAVL